MFGQFVVRSPRTTNFVFIACRNGRHGHVTFPFFVWENKFAIFFFFLLLRFWVSVLVLRILLMVFVNL